MALGATAGCARLTGPSRSFGSSVGDWSTFRADRGRSGGVGAPDPAVAQPTVAWRVKRPADDRRRFSLLGSVAVVAGNGTAWAFDATSGEHLAMFDRERAVSCEVLAADGDLVAAELSAVTRIDPGTGERQWTAELGQPATECYEGACHETPHRVGTPTVSDGRVVVAGATRRHERAYALSSLSLSDGSLVWERPLAVPYARTAVVTPVVADGRVFVQSTTGRRVLAFDFATGDRVWATGDRGEDPRRRQSYRPVVAGDSVVSRTPDGDVVARALADGSERWRRSVTAESGGRPLLAADGDRVYVAGKNALAALDPTTGDSLWSVTESAGHWQRPAVADGAIYVARNYRSSGGPTHRNEVWAYDAATGNRRWRWVSSVKGTAGSVTVGPAGVYLPFTTDVWKHEAETTVPTPSVGVTRLVDRSVATATRTGG